jgi:hypothetical protein
MVPAFDELPNEIKIHFEQLTMIEEMLISPILAIMSVFRLPGGALINRGFCANFTQDIEPLCKTLPRLTKDLPVLILKKKDQQNNTKQFIVNRHRVEICLEFLCNNNPQYKIHGIKFDRDRLNGLPLNEVPSDLPEQIDRDNLNIDEILVDQGPQIHENSDSNDIDTDYHAFIETENDEPLQIDNIKNSINYPTANRTAINEFTFDNICTLLFPKLFPTGVADPTSKSNTNLFF